LRTLVRGSDWKIPAIPSGAGIVEPGVQSSGVAIHVLKVFYFLMAAAIMGPKPGWPAASLVRESAFFLVPLIEGKGVVCRRFLLPGVQPPPILQARSYSAQRDAPIIANFDFMVIVMSS